MPDWNEVGPKLVKALKEVLPHIIVPTDGPDMDASANAYTRARDAIAKAEEITDGGWQPIETAPKDGTPILFCSYGYGVWVGHYNPAPDGGWSLGYPSWEARNPIHWMPLPEPPKETSDG